MGPDVPDKYPFPPGWLPEDVSERDARILEEQMVQHERIAVLAAEMKLTLALCSAVFVMLASHLVAEIA